MCHRTIHAKDDKYPVQFGLSPKILLQPLSGKCYLVLVEGCTATEKSLSVGTIWKQNQCHQQTGRTAEKHTNTVLSTALNRMGSKTELVKSVNCVTEMTTK